MLYIIATRTHSVIVDMMMLIVIIIKRGEEGKEFKALYYASAAAICNYIIIYNIIPNNKWGKEYY